LIGYASYNEYTKSPVVSKIWPGISLVISGALTGVMGVRFQNTGGFFPAGFVTTTSAAMSLFYVWKLTQKQKPSTKKKY
jgi:hypothetical protein